MVTGLPVQFTFSMSYESAVASMFALGHELAQTPSHKFDLAHIRVLLRELRHPEQDFPSVLIAGTNGKGSTAATLGSILRASGLKTGLYTSPHLVRINERIRINGLDIGDHDFAALHAEVDDTAGRLVEAGDLPWHPSFFEMMTAIAFVHFSRQKIDTAVLEVGMGGRLDATNVVEPAVSIITDISLDHQKFLGNTVAEIAREKAGIIRRQKPVITLPQQPQANEVIGNAILNLDAIPVSAVQYMPPVSPGSAPTLADREEKPLSRYPLEVMGERIMVESPLVGRHQLRNIALAIAAAEQLSHNFPAITARAIERGIRETSWPGRFQLLRIPGRAQVILDVAHNPAGAWALRSALSEQFEGQRLTFIFGAMRDKAISEMTEILFPLAARIIATRADNPRSASPEEIQQAAGRTGAAIEIAPDVASALKQLENSPKNEIVVITGSIYVVGEAMRILTRADFRA